MIFGEMPYPEKTSGIRIDSSNSEKVKGGSLERLSYEVSFLSA